MISRLNIAQLELATNRVAVNSGKDNDSAGHAKFEIYNNIAFEQYFDNDRVIAPNPSIKSAITSDLPLMPPTLAPPPTPQLINAQIFVQASGFPRALLADSTRSLLLLFLLCFLIFFAD